METKVTEDTEHLFEINHPGSECGYLTRLGEIPDWSNPFWIIDFFQFIWHGQNRDDGNDKK